MKKVMVVILVTLLAGVSAMSQAQQALTKELITSFQVVSQQWQSLEDSYPELASSLDDIDLSEPDKILAQIKNSKAYPKIKSMLADTEFANVEEYYDVATRLMGGMMALQMDSMPDGMNVDSMGEMLRNSIAQMKASNAPSAMVSEMEKQLADMEKNMQVMNAAMKNTSAADRKFISDNAQWIMSILDNEE